MAQLPVAHQGYVASCRNAELEEFSGLLQPVSDTQQLFTIYIHICIYVYVYQTTMIPRILVREDMQGFRSSTVGFCFQEPPK